jgi:Ca2+-binding RTX toxin-like protein
MKATRLAALAAAVAAGFAATAVPADAAVSSVSRDADIVTLELDGADDHVTVSVSGGLLVHDQTTGGLNSGSDWSSEKEGDQTLPADGTITVVLNGGDGDDTLKVLAKVGEIAGAKLHGDGGDDTLIGADTSDFVDGGDGNDRLVGAGGIDAVVGEAGNDTAVWNDGDGSDRITGDAGDDGAEVNGSPTLGDAFTLEPVSGGVRLRRTNLDAVKLDIATERLQVDGLGGDDDVAAADGVGALTALSVDGGAGADTIVGSEGPDLISGGAGADTIDARAGDDHVDVRDTIADVARGGAGTDSVVADATAIDVLDAFESVDRTPDVTPPPGTTPPPVVTPPPDTAPRPVTIGGRTVHVSRRERTASIKVSCPAASPGNCAGVLAIRTAKRAGVKQRRELGKARYNLASGTSRTLKVKLAKVITRLAARDGHVKALALAATRSAGTTVHSSRHLTLLVDSASRRS